MGTSGVLLSMEGEVEQDKNAYDIPNMLHYGGVNSGWFEWSIKT
jgi:hypothetical protein